MWSSAELRRSGRRSADAAATASASSELRKQERELVAAEAEGLAVLAQVGRDLREHAVAGRVSEEVVDALEVVDVDQAEAEAGACALGLDQLALEAVVEVAVVAKAGQRIGQGELHRA